LIELLKTRKEKKAERAEEAETEETSEKPNKPLYVSKFKKQKTTEKSNKNKHTEDATHSRKGKGDVKKEGKLEPFAYLPLDPKSLNRRNKKRSGGQFKNIVAAAKKGAQVKPARQTRRRK